MGRDEAREPSHLVEAGLADLHQVDADLVALCLQPVDRAERRLDLLEMRSDTDQMDAVPRGGREQGLERDALLVGSEDDLRCVDHHAERHPRGHGEQVDEAVRG